jgi:hypothetical protein
MQVLTTSVVFSQSLFKILEILKADLIWFSCGLQTPICKDKLDWNSWMLLNMCYDQGK